MREGKGTKTRIQSVLWSLTVLNVPMTVGCAAGSGNNSTE